MSTIKPIVYLVISINLAIVWGPQFVWLEGGTIPNVTSLLFSVLL